MTQPIRVLVTAVGGDLGQALVKTLRLSSPQIALYGCDMDGTGVGSAFVDSFHVVPRADDPTYIEVMDHLCRSLKVHAVLPGSEQEIYVLSRLGSLPKLPCGIPIVCQEASWIETYGDKLTCVKSLWGKIDLAPFADGADPQAVARLIEEVGFPVVVKTRRSSGSRDLTLVKNNMELDTALTRTRFPLVQAFVDESGGEFSVGVFVCQQFSSVIGFKRDLGPVGCSWFAETSSDQSVLDYAMKIAQSSCLRGSANIQVRKSSRGVQLLEVNPRFSSLVAARAACGFRDAEWSVDLALGQNPERPNIPFKHIRFRRFFHEVVDFGEGFNAASEWAPREESISNLTRSTK
jgi:carbamoyl-phosphate synthase large subunit